ncbi:MAG: hypothetical protein KJ749_02455 [Planctomycetes bacterium]|nr:hypothetical protein [Planctomycetota bacterium]
MLRHQRLEHRFVKHIPDRLESGVLYVSVEYGTASHLCCCGCGEEVVTPFTPTDWKLIFDGETVSLSPSIGNWTLRCRTHYVIDRSRVIEAGPWSEVQISAEHRRNRVAKKRFYGTHECTDESGDESSPPPHQRQSSWSRLWEWLMRDIFRVK